MLAGPYRAAKIEVERQATVAELGCAALASCIEQILRNDRGARAGKDPEYTHQLRVGVRRLRVGLRLFDKLVGAERAGALAEELRWIFRRLGHVREFDVLLGLLDARATGDASKSTSEPERERGQALAAPTRSRARAPASALAAELARERAKAARALRRAFASERYRRVLRSLRALAAALETPRSDGRRARKWAAKRLDKRLAAVLRVGHAISQPDPALRHELRKKVKKLRYTAELVGGLWRAGPRKRYLEELGALQDLLGELNDAAVGHTLLNQAAKPLRGAHARAARATALELAAEADQGPAELARRFAKLERAKPFWR